MFLWLTRIIHVLSAELLAKGGILYRYCANFRSFIYAGFTISALAGTLHRSIKTDKNAKRFHLVS